MLILQGSSVKRCSRCFSGTSWMAHPTSRTREYLVQTADGTRHCKVPSLQYRRFAGGVQRPSCVMISAQHYLASSRTVHTQLREERNALQRTPATQHYVIFTSRWGEAVVSRSQERCSYYNQSGDDSDGKPEIDYFVTADRPECLTHRTRLHRLRWEQR